MGQSGIIYKEFDRAKTAAVVRCNALAEQGCLVFGGSITGVVFPAVAGIAQGQKLQQVVPANLGYN